MNFSREMSRLMFGLLLAFFVVVASAAYWAIVGADSILLREDNPRLVEDEAAIRRGAIYDRRTALLAESVVVDGLVERHYLHPEIYSAVGYFSLRYGVAGAEAAYDAILRGDSQNTGFDSYFDQALLHRPQVGAAIRLSLDLGVQGSIVEAMGNHRGAAVVLSVPNGEVLALVSLPSYDPNTLDADWESLIEAEGNPFFNRVLQGQYQAGGMLETPLMTAGILTQQPFDIVTNAANLPIRVDDVVLTCGVNPPKDDLSYSEAYAYACPRPFALLAEQISPSTLENIIADFRLETPPSLEGFVVENEAIEATPEVTSETNESSFIADVLGQGDLTINPLGMASLAGAIIHGGNAPQPYALLDIQDAQGNWFAASPTPSSLPVMTEHAALRMRDLMIGNLDMGTAVNAAHEGETIGGHAAIAISGETSQAWFIGFIQIDGNLGASVAIVLENSSDAQLTAQIGGLALQRAAISLRESSN
jgi:peptidoglycan glycosyltransferase